MSEYHLAQLNLARARYPMEAPEMQGFVDNLENINALAEDSPGFIWRLQTESGDATEIDYYGPGWLVNMSIWESTEALQDFVFRTAHAEFMSQRKQWFDRLELAYVVLWWVPAGHVPDLDEANQRLEMLRAQGPGPQAFNFRQSFPPPKSG